MDTPAFPFDFQTQVLDRSHQIPVLVDFWAPWCGPCRMLGPVLEQMAEETDEWALVKINTEEESDLARQFRIQSIPHVKLFVQGKAVADFSGALSQGAIRNWLDTHLPDPCREAWNQLKHQLPPWPREDRRTLLDTLDHHCHGHEEWILARAAMDLFDHPESLPGTLSFVHPGHPLFQQAEAILELSRLVSLEQNETASDSMIQAANACKHRHIEETIQALIRAIGEDRSQLDELPRKALVGLFALLGEDHALTREYRPWFAMALN
ncbi:MAG: tetratricopeptide repeat protein [Lewinellaceae bacterium]|nr:tetratricopeptide repeat protein [Lewinellaceae bacterium]